MTDIATRLANLQLPTITPTEGAPSLALRRVAAGTADPQLVVTFTDGTTLDLEVYDTTTNEMFTVPGNPFAFSQICTSTLSYIRGQMTRTQLMDGDPLITANLISSFYLDESDPENPTRQSIDYPSPYSYYDLGANGQSCEIPY